eukprot:8130570-Ditylum_brightwellii.AAC.1
MKVFNTLQLHIQHKQNLSCDAAFIVAGGSHGENLASWLLLKNLNLWAVALASSTTPFKHLLQESNSFSKIEPEVYGNVSSTCPYIVQHGWMKLFENIKSNADVTWSNMSYNSVTCQMRESNILKILQMNYNCARGK